jgi:hypothetical protein
MENEFCRLKAKTCSSGDETDHILNDCECFVLLSVSVLMP